MAMVIRALVKGYYIFNDDWSGSPWPVFSILAFYLYFVFKLGPALMKHRKALNLDRIIQVYNVVQVVICSWLVYEGYDKLYGPNGKYSWVCEPIDFSTDYLAVHVTKFVWVYFMIKVIDLLDTVFFVLRKKNSQATFLHVYHHTGMVILGWAGTKYMAGGHGVFVGVINCFVHIVMYAYYFISNYNPEYKKNLWWKKHITQLQMFQFFCITLHFSHAFLNPHCTYPKWAMAVFLPQNFFMLVLFWDFYKKAYLAPRTSAPTQTTPPTNRTHEKAS